MSNVKIKVNLDHGKLEEMGYIYSIMEGGYVSPNGATIVSISRAPYQRQVMQYRANAEVEHLANVELLNQVGALE
ncbi:hypothetical protein [Lysinibacillus xylanilyticus]|uniref:hypothetical protein n=1 Tax=Lysinibacillus xylanilyticus TaxID=582475 RepID=UPI003D026171